MLAAFARAKAAGVEAIVFGDIYLQDLRSYREQLLARAGLQGLFPLWNRDSAGLARAIADAGIRATVVCVDGQRLDVSHCGREFNPQFVAALPAGVDPCGERGEYHSFVHAMPAFSRPIEVVAGEKVWRDPFWFCDLLPAQAQAAAA